MSNNFISPNTITGNGSNIHKEILQIRAYPMKSHLDLQEPQIYYQGVDHHAGNHGQRSFQQTLPPMPLPPIWETNQVLFENSWLCKKIIMEDFEVNIKQKIRKKLKPLRIFPNLLILHQLWFSFNKLFITMLVL